MARIYLGIGTNMGNRLKNIHQAMDLLEEHGIDVLRISTIIETEPVGGPPQNRYLNGVIEAETTLKPQLLLQSLKRIEKSLGRVNTVPNGPRPIDLDILLYDTKVIEEPGLIIPHPRMFERDFVMEPLKELAPDLVNKLIYANH